MDMSLKQKSIKNGHDVANILVLCAMTISLISIIGFAFPMDNKSTPALAGIFAIVNVLIWSMAIWYKINANHEEMKSLLMERSH